MDDGKKDDARGRDGGVRTAVILLGLAHLLMLPAYLLPLQDPLPWDHLAATIPFALGLSASASVDGAPIAAFALGVLFISRHGFGLAQRAKEFLLLAVVLAVFLGGGSYLNEHALKPSVSEPRPNIELLASTPSASAPALGMSAGAFYALGDKATRRAYLEKILESPTVSDELRLPPALRRHWIAETGYSFPSGHAFAAMFIATFFMLLGVRFDRGWRLWIVRLLPLWALLVAYSRILLIVHTPNDVLLGSLLGVLGASAAFVTARPAIERLSRPG